MDAGLAAQLASMDTLIRQLQGRLGGLRIVSGTVNSTGSILGGTGFTITKGATGLYSILFTTAFSGIPDVVVTPITNLDRGGAQLSTGTRTAAQIDVFLFDTSSAANADTSFAFIASGAA
jgi:hypothetical protein